jgi:cytochrome c oxidase assembly protein subunit 11
MNERTDRQNRKVAGIAGFVAIGMFGFGFALIPLYNVLCDAFGINGSFTDIENGTYNVTEETKKALANGVDHSRTVTMQFLVNDSVGLDLDFYPLVKRLDMNPGEVKEVSYYVKNRSDKTITIQAIPDITPNLAKKYLAKIECFCFRQQTLKPGEERKMPLRFVVNSAIPNNIGILTMTYRFIDSHYKAQTDIETGFAQLAKIELGPTGNNKSF